ncbi:uncharacterized protein LOC111471569 [Cucurbita maxima]|uniref:Uncharacterized protein LOC111471569 n=1 Tax=Cucurbita maxima TaxID=3661 RepID=A0A6J1I7P1_CUCMA|nr:uncharacterized protein LOC111471569 [Cucurbita maxima]
MAVISVRNSCAHINVDGNANIYGFLSADVNRLEKVVETILDPFKYLVRMDTLLLDSCKISGWTDKEQHYGFYITQELSGFWGAESTICCHHSPFSNYNWEWRLLRRSAPNLQTVLYRDDNGD